VRTKVIRFSGRDLKMKNVGYELEIFLIIAKFAGIK